MPTVLRETYPTAKKEHICDFCDGDLCVSVVVEGKQADFHFEPVTLKMFAYAYKLHCEELKDEGNK